MWERVHKRHTCCIDFTGGLNRKWLC